VAPIERYLNLLVDQLLYDIHVFSQPWLYYCLLVPAAAYFAWFLVKWWVLLVPVTLPMTWYWALRKSEPRPQPWKN
jgi:hypothetical protein